MSKYLIMKCHELGDQWECDADRTPICMVNDWCEWYSENHPSFLFEVYELKANNTFDCIKSYDDVIESGMALCYWNADEDTDEDAPHIIQRWANATRNDKVPQIVKKHQKNAKKIYDELNTCGHISWTSKNGAWFCYGEYEDTRFDRGY